MNLNQRVLLDDAEVELFRLVLLRSNGQSGCVLRLSTRLSAEFLGSSTSCSGPALTGARDGGASVAEFCLTPLPWDVVSAFLRAGCAADVNVISDVSGRSALYQSIVRGHDSTARKLLLAGADVHRKGPVDRRVPLHAAVGGEHGGLVGELLIGGACPNAQDQRGRTPLHLAAELGHENIVTMLLDSSRTDFDAIDDVGFSPLMVAGTEGHVSIVRALLAAGADRSPREHNDFASVLDLAAKHGYTEVVNALLDHGADVNEADTLGWTALHFASHDDQAGTADLLIAAGADINATDHMGQTPLHFSAIYSSSNDALRTLLRRGAKMNEADDDGNTALHLVCREVPDDAIETVGLLLRAGASEAAVNQAGDTPIELPHWVDQQVAQRIRGSLRRAPADRAWRRRGWLVMLRARTERERRAQPVEDNNNRGEMGEIGGRPHECGRGGAGNSGKKGKAEGGGSAKDGRAGEAAEGEEVLGDVWSDCVSIGVCCAQFSWGLSLCCRSM